MLVIQIKEINLINLCKMMKCKGKDERGQSQGDRSVAMVFGGGKVTRIEES